MRQAVNIGRSRATDKRALNRLPINLKGHYGALAPPPGRGYRSNMPGKLSPKAQTKLAALQDFSQKIQHVYSLVEQFAADRAGRNSEALSMAMKRGFAQLKRDFMGAGMDSLSQLAGGMEIAAGRRTSLTTKSRILRDGIGSLKFQVELEQRVTVTEDEREQERQQES